MSVWLHSSKHEPPAGVVIEGLWHPEKGHQGEPVRGWIRHEVVKCTQGEWHLIGPYNGTCMANPPVYWRVQNDVPPPPTNG